MTNDQLAGKFSAVLREWLTAEEMAEVVRLNGLETNPAVCHSHDFCDANQALLDAMGADFNGTDSQTARINAAWAIAKRTGFAV